MEDLGRGGPGDPGVDPQGADAADAEEHLLQQPVLGRSAVQPVGHVALGRLVVLDPGVEQQQRHPADLGDPDLGRERPVAGKRDVDPGRGPVGLAEQGEWHRLRVDDRVALLLPAVGRERLLEVAVAVEQSHPDHGSAEVAGGLEVVAGKDAEPAGVLRQNRTDAEFGREVRDSPRNLRSQAVVSAVLGEVVTQICRRAFEPVEEGPVAGQLIEAFGAHLTEQANRIMAGRLPQSGVDGGEEVLGRRMPTPAEVHGQLAERGEGRREHWSDREATDGTHEGTR